MKEMNLATQSETRSLPSLVSERCIQKLLPIKAPGEDWLVGNLGTTAHFHDCMFVTSLLPNLERGIYAVTIRPSPQLFISNDWVHDTKCWKLANYLVPLVFECKYCAQPH